MALLRAFSRDSEDVVHRSVCALRDELELFMNHSSVYVALEMNKMAVECHFDGRLVKIVLGAMNLSEVLNEHCMYVDMYPGGRIETVFKGVVDDVGMNIIRVIVTSSVFSHSALIFYKEGDAWWFNPRDDTRESTIINCFLKILCLEELREKVGDNTLMIAEMNSVMEDKCASGGYCNAYVLKCIVDWAEGREADYSNIDRFAATMKRLYRRELEEDEREEERQTSLNPGGAALGGTLGGTLGGLLGGVPGLVVGAGLGAVIGGRDVRSHSRSDSECCLR